jgi:hypothetical protein
MTYCVRASEARQGRYKVTQREQRWGDGLSLEKAPGGRPNVFLDFMPPLTGFPRRTPLLPTAFRRGPDDVGPYGPRPARIRHRARTAVSEVPGAEFTEHHRESSDVGQGKATPLLALGLWSVCALCVFAPLCYLAHVAIRYKGSDRALAEIARELKRKRRMSAGGAP